ncbi:phage protease [Roseobacter sp. YSTF-M11]|uniref:Phage protease n=1 Tax=Roseobacter insulae TaxID=2859783 RepID=A0A9X1K2K9_9RHOB|nr:phage protease [Roseobacter insulae]MBW4708628.1 phage protease [Roseobacter insulae]
MTLADHLTALMSAQSLPDTVAENAAPEWIHLLPAGEAGVIGTSDARGPYHVTNPDQIIAASFAVDDRLPIDENHATDLAAPSGQPAPARGWIVAMEARPDGIWGQVEWTTQGAELVTSRAYRGISPVIVHPKNGPKTIQAILRASLVNKPNLRGMTSLHQQETGMNFREKLIEMLSIDAASSDDDIMKALSAKMKGKGSDAAMQSALGEVGVALGLEADAKPDAIVAAAQAATKSDDKTIAALQASNAALTSTVTELSATVTSLQEGQSDAASESFFQTALAERRAGVNEASKDKWIALHQADPENAAALIAALPKLGKTATTLEPPAPKDGEVSLNADQRLIASQLGLTEEAYAKSLQSENKEAS